MSAHQSGNNQKRHHDCKYAEGGHERLGHRGGERGEREHRQRQRQQHPQRAGGRSCRRLSRRKSIRDPLHDICDPPWALHEDDDEEQLREKEIAPTDRSHQPILTNSRNRILMHHECDDGGGRQKLQQGSRYYRQAGEEMPRAETRPREKSFERRQRRDERPQQLPILLHDVQHHHDSTPSRTAGASVVKIERSVMGFTSM